MMIRTFVLLFFMASSIAPAAEPPTMPPVDESPGHPAFHRFYRKFQRAVEDRDGAFVLSVAAKGIKLDFGGGEGRDEFVSRWEPARKDGPLWKELDKIIALGGALEKKEDGTLFFIAPCYASMRWPEALDAFEHIVVTGREVNFRSGPSTDGAVVRKVSWEIMKLVERGEGDWVKLRAHDGTVGYVHADYVRSPVGYRIGFEEDGKGGFEMTFLIAGD